MRGAATEKFYFLLRLLAVHIRDDNQHKQSTLLNENGFHFHFKTFGLICQVNY